MKFDIVRSWKDEAYRQTLSQEQLDTLSANPAGELSDAELSIVCGDGDGDIGAAGGSASSSSSSHFFASERRTHSFSLVCDINIFSLDVHIIGVDHLINIAQHETQICINND